MPYIAYKVPIRFLSKGDPIKYVFDKTESKARWSAGISNYRMKSDYINWQGIMLDDTDLIRHLNDLKYKWFKGCLIWNSLSVLFWLLRQRLCRMPFALSRHLWCDWEAECMVRLDSRARLAKTDALSYPWSKPWSKPWLKPWLKP